MTKLKSILFVFIFLLFSLFGYMKLGNKSINDLMLNVFSWVKKIKGNAVNLDGIDETSRSLVNHDIWTELLQKYVTDSGQVNYKGFIEEQAKMDQYLNLISDTPPGSNWSETDKIAYWINAYNAFTVKLIMDNYPLKSIKDIGDGMPMINSSWDIKFFKIGDVDFDLNTIEHEILRKKFEEPRIHFAINCASFSCPKLRNEAFESNRLNQQLEEQAKEFINNPDKNIINKEETKLSKIFSWFETDFTKKTTIKTFIKQYHSAFNDQNDIQYIGYIWTLNE